MKLMVNYADTASAWENYEVYLKDLITKNKSLKICDLGGGANPALSLEFIRSNNLDYTILDISQNELEKAPSEYRKICADICTLDLKIESKFDLVFSKMLMEHVQDAKIVHENIHKLLNPKGVAFHFIPTLYSFPFLMNLLIPEYFTRKLLDFFAPRDHFQAAKFSAYYDWCRGPTPTQLDRFKSLSYDILEYRGFFGHSYFGKVPFLRKLNELLSKILLSHPLPLITSYAYIVVQKQ